MALLNISSIINEWVENKLNLPFTISNDVIPETNGDAACMRFDPAPAAEKRFNDGSRLLKWNLSYYIRCKNRENARRYAYDITAALDGMTIKTDGVCIDTNAQTLPQFISTDDKQNTIYCAAITCSYIETNEE